MAPLALWFVLRPTLTWIQPLVSTVQPAGSDTGDVDSGGDTPSSYAGRTRVFVHIPNFEIWKKFRQWLRYDISQRMDSKSIKSRSVNYFA